MSANGTPVLAASDLSRTRGSAFGLERVSFALGAGERLAIAGPSGSGKSTLIRLLTGLEPASAGEVSIAGRLATRAGEILIPPEARNLAVVFQDLALWPHLSAAGNLDFVLRSRRVVTEERRRRIREALAVVRLDGFDQRSPGTLSGGERQRLAIARALVLEPAALLLDEPLSNLDLETKSEIVSLLRELLAARKLSAILVTHDPRDAKLLADRVMVLEQGRITCLEPLDLLRARASTSFARAFAEGLG